MINPLPNIATRLKKLRKEKGWSLDVASKETGVSKAMLGQIEREESVPTIATLWKIASGFNVSFSLFMEELSEANFVAGPIRSPALNQFHADEKDFLVMPLFPYDDFFKFEMFIIEIFPGCERLSPPHQAGVVEHVVVTEGEMEVFADETWRRIGKNQGYAFLADKPHGYRNLSKKKAVFSNIIHYQFNVKENLKS